MIHNFDQFFTTAKIRVWASIFLSVFMLMGCVDESSREGKQATGRFGATDTETEAQFCEDTYNIVTGTCITGCPIGTRVASLQEIEDSKDELANLVNTGDLALEEFEDIISNIESSEQVCVNGSGVLRPDGEVFVNSDYCACFQGEAWSRNNCDATCAGRSDTDLTLVGNVDVGPTIVNNDELVNLDGWCNGEITVSDFKGPSCQLEAFNDQDGRRLMDVNIIPGTNRFTANLEVLDREKVYILKIIESGSGSNVESSAFQIYLKEPDSDTTNPSGALRIMASSQYTCVFRSRQTDNQGNETFEEYARQHFYFAASNKPPGLPPGDPLVVCHDIQVHGDVDSSEFPRLELVNQHFAVWDQSDVRFNDGDTDGVVDINETITEEFKIRTNQQNNGAVELNLFSVFAWPNLPETNGLKDITNANLGMIMIPFIDNQNKGECPKQNDYLGDNILYNIVGEYVGVDTEGLYMAESDAIPDGQGGNILDIIMIRETDLKQVWFYNDGTQRKIPNESNAGSKTIRFFYPLDFDNPLIKKSNQILYTIRFPDEVGKNGVQTGVVSGNRPSDKRFACIPTSN